METETMYPSLLPMIEIVALIAAFFAVAGFAIYLAGVVWLCFEEMRRPARRRMKPTPPEPDKYDLLGPWPHWPRLIETWATVRRYDGSDGKAAGAAPKNS